MVPLDVHPNGQVPFAGKGCASAYPVNNTMMMMTMNRRGVILGPSATTGAKKSPPPELDGAQGADV
jgi:hypothetical protein